MTVSAVTTNPATSASGGSGISNSDQLNLNNQIAGNFSTFLTLLTTQLQNQNPLDRSTPTSSPSSSCSSRASSSRST